ncbi:MerR family transcriptional regulator [Bifidobacterium avesanii]|uniref:MerR family transcriptional regulator n=1 Tax=Bifidobacterium avesanii TaxID=1798157 RepID=A0A7K3TFP4_9BIFI|nr:MerR family transcriptional regulator [Bifidobacterium avesanii]KAB8295499.1 MerR family transcriptional regulator [Bifidobacterium avesanii]NEG77504.1 MerR family transcriptional regulator [Bifidobacterium avesanii]
MAVEETTYTIREVARRFHMQPSTLRYYEDSGLLTNVGRTETGQRLYRDCHINRLRTICCFKHAGMSIEELKRFFSFESDEEGHIDEIMTLLEARRAAIEEQERLLAEAHAHILRKLHYYGDIRSAAAAGEPRPDWADYRHAVFED